jgi:hypothetical protein
MVHAQLKYCTHRTLRQFARVWQLLAQFQPTLQHPHQSLHHHLVSMGRQLLHAVLSWAACATKGIVWWVSIPCDM